MFMKNPDAVIGDGGTGAAAGFQRADVMFAHRSGAGARLCGPARAVPEQGLAPVRLWPHVHDGYHRAGARDAPRGSWDRGSANHSTRSGPIGPCITTADEVEDPNNPWVQFWNDRQLRQPTTTYTDDMEHRVLELRGVRLIIVGGRCALGDLICCGTNHEGSLVRVERRDTGDASSTTVWAGLRVRVEEPLRAELGAGHLYEAWTPPTTTPCGANRPQEARLCCRKGAGR